MFSSVRECWRIFNDASPGGKFLTAYNLPQWSAFFSVEASSSAALIGLLFVAVSINLSKIVGSPLLVARSAKALLTLTGVLLAATVCLIPGQPDAILGVELIVVGALSWIFITIMERRSSQNNPYTGKFQKVSYVILAQGSALPTVVCGIFFLAGRRGGLYGLVAGMLVSVVTALLDAWVLLVEILR